ncbi:MAG TPA: archaeosortase/exosortase family protein [Candidatus Xenobia bacterium]|jgi:exosortase/archaeosortase family protein
MTRWGLVVGALAIWGLVASRWLPENVEADLPVAICLPLFYWLARPWVTSPVDRGRPGVRWAAGGLLAAMLYLGSVTGAVVAWNILLWSWLHGILEEASWQRARALWLLPLLAWPWLRMDGLVLAHAIRQVDAWAVLQVFTLMGAPAVLVGTTVVSPDFTLNIVDGCAGLGTLHSMLIAGAVLAFVQDQPLTRWQNVGKVVAVAFIANTVRIVCIGWLGLMLGAEYAEGPMHDWTGWILVLVFFNLAFPPPPRPLHLERYIKPRPASFPEPQPVP